MFQCKLLLSCLCDMSVEPRFYVWIQVLVGSNDLFVQVYSKVYLQLAGETDVVSDK